MLTKVQTKGDSILLLSMLCASLAKLIVLHLLYLQTLDILRATLKQKQSHGHGKHIANTTQTHQLQHHGVYISTYDSCSDDIDWVGNQSFNYSVLYNDKKLRLPRATNESNFLLRPGFTLDGWPRIYIGWLAAATVWLAALFGAYCRVFIPASSFL